MAASDDDNIAEVVLKEAEEKVEDDDEQQQPKLSTINTTTDASVEMTNRCSILHDEPQDPDEVNLIERQNSNNVVKKVHDHHDYIEDNKQEKKLDISSAVRVCF